MTDSHYITEPDSLTGDFCLARIRSMAGSITKKGKAARLKILDNSIKLFEELGYKETTIKEICRASAVGVGTFYHYFSSKQDILDEFIAFEQEEILKEITEYEDPSFIKKINKLLEILFKYIELKGKEFMAAFLAKNMTNPQPENIFKVYNVREILRALLHDGEAAGQFRCVESPDYVCEILATMVIGYLSFWSSLRDSGKSEEELEQYRKNLSVLISTLLC
ncbi:TetR/AcrR family transcriptional regulator [Oceanispirochaeta sp. M1]|nr:TetR/AcrR family transcriptional regulator [Oceanispirochaeta sp. M1]